MFEFAVWCIRRWRSSRTRSRRTLVCTRSQSSQVTESYARRCVAPLAGRMRIVGHVSAGPRVVIVLHPMCVALAVTAA